MYRNGSGKEIQREVGGEVLQYWHHISREKGDKKCIILEIMIIPSGKAIIKEDRFDLEGKNDA